MPKANIQLLSTQLLARIERIRFNPIQKLSNKHSGEQLTRQRGTSTEFSDYREYSHGDDTRFIDWNIFARLQKPYMKLYQMEEERHVLIILDATESMGFENKLERAKELAAMFSTIGLYSNDRISIYVINEQEKRIKNCLTNKQGRMNIPHFSQFINNVKAGGNMMLDKAIPTILNYHNGRGIAIILSDFLTLGDMQKPFNRLFSAGLECYAVQILAPMELEPELNGDLRLIDSETEQALDVSSAGELLSLYHEYKNGLQNDLKMMCKQRLGRFLWISSNEKVESILTHKLIREGWVK